VCFCRVPGIYIYICVCIHAGAIDAVGGGGSGRRALSWCLSLSLCRTRCSLSTRSLFAGEKSFTPEIRSSAGEVKSAAVPPVHGPRVVMATPSAYTQKYIYNMYEHYIMYIYTYTAVAAADCNIYNTPPPPLFVGRARRSATPPPHTRKNPTRRCFSSFAAYTYHNIRTSIPIIRRYTAHYPYV